MNIRPPGMPRAVLPILFSAFLFFSPMFPQPAFAEKRPVLSDMISYWSPQWLTNDRIIYIKWIEHKRYWYGFLADLSNSGTIHLGEDYQICSADLDGKNEKVIRAFSTRRDRKGIIGVDELLRQDDGGKTEGVLIPRMLSYNPAADLIAFSGQYNGGIIVMNGNGTDARRLDVDGYAPAISPDGKKILYHKAITTHERNEHGVSLRAHTEHSNWLVNSDGTDNRKIMDNATAAIWHPDGKRVIFYRDYDIYIFNLENNSEERLFEKMSPPIDIFPDGGKIFFGRGIYDFSSGKTVYLKNIPNSARISSDGSRVLGEPVDISAKIGVVNIDGTDLRGIFSDYAITIK